MSALRSFRGGRLRRARSIATVIVLIAVGLMWISAAQGVHDNGMFELDGNTVHNSGTTLPYDWNSLFGSSGNRLITPDPINGPLLADVFVSDAAVPDQSYFTSNKDIQPIASGSSHWGCDPINNPLNKDDLQNAYAALLQVPANAPDNAGDQVLYLGSERGSNNGTSFAGFWLLKDKNVGCSGSNDFSGQHTDGDILIVSDYTNGGGTQDVSVYRWTGNDATGKPVLDTTFNGSICSASLSNDDACAIANNAAITTPWSPTLHASNTFVETGIDLTTLLGANGGCFTDFLAETRSSDVLTATLKDFAGGTFNTCVAPPVGTTATPGGSTNPIGVANQHDVATISPVTGRPDPTGTMTFFLCNPSQVTAGGCVSGGTQVGSAVPIASGSAASDNASGSLTTTPGKYCWRAEYAPDADGSKFYVAGSHTDATDECFTVVKSSPSIVTTPNPTSVTLGTSSVTLKDSAVLSGGSSPTGTITFTLVHSGATVDTETVSVSGNNTYTTPTGYTLPTSGTVTGTYQWNATYSGDANNNTVSENNDASERVTVNLASPGLVTTATPHGTVTLDNTGSPTLNDSAALSGGYNPTGTITFTLKYNGSTVYTDHVTVASGNGTYSTAAGDNPGGYTLPGSSTVTGSYVWTASYGGDGNNNTASDPGTSALEQVTVAKASPGLVTTATPHGTVTLDNTGSPTLNDSAALSGGYNPTGTITFTLKYNGSTVYTDHVTVASGNGTYSTAAGDNPGGYTLPGSSTVTGSYVWTASYGGDGNNNTASDPGTSALEQVTVNPAQPAITTVPSESAGSVNDLLNDTATLTDGTLFDGSGTITFNLYSPSDPTCDGTPAYTETVTADHNGDYTTSNTTVLADASGIWNWTATFSGDGNNAKALSGCGEEEVGIAAPVIHIEKTADQSQVSAGDDIGFRMTVWNSGNGDAKGVTLTDPLPQNPGTSWSVDAAGAGFGGGTGPDCSIAPVAGVATLTCGPETVAAGGSSADKATSTFWVHITSHTDKTTGGDCVETSGVVDNTGSVTTSNDGNDSSEATICVAPADVSIAKTADHSAPVHAGDPIGFTVEVKNTGTGVATGVILSDPLPAGSGSGVTWTIDASVGTPSQFVLSGAKGSQKLSLATSTLPAGADYKVHLTAGTSETECGTYDNTATLTTTNANSPTPVSAEESCAFRVDLSIAKSGSPATQVLGTGNITWTMVVTNHGPDTDTNVKVSDPMPAGNTYVSSTTSQGTCTGGAALNCDIGTMAAGQQVTITLVTTPSSAGTQTNTAVVSGDRPETTLTNNTATATVQITDVILPPPCVAVHRITPGQLIVGRKTTLTVHLTQGGKAAAGFRVRIKGAGINVVTKRSNAKGVIKRVVKMKKKGVLTFTPIGGQNGGSCGGKRIGVRGVFTPPVTG